MSIFRGNKSAVVMLALYFVFGLFQGISANVTSTEFLGRGLSEHTEEHIQHMENNWHKVVGVRANKVGGNRINQHLDAHGHPPMAMSIALSVHDEHVAMSPSGEMPSMHGALGLNDPLPTHVNNSTLPSFPPIGNQQNQGSCVAWGSTYYQASHEIGLFNGINNKASFAGVYSPKWTYNLLNGGYDGGLNVLTAYQLLSANGAISIVNLPYDPNDYRAWDLNPQDWVSAMSARMSSPQLVTGIGGTQQNLQTIKQILNNGHVLTFGTFISSWVFTTIKADPANPGSPYVGQYAASWMNGSNGGHCMTIVGYDDNIWIDVNGNGQVDAGERGAFLIANSWGTGWGNAGFIWISYDAFLATSAVPNGPNTGRVPAAAALNNYVVSAVPKAAHYSPKLFAQFSLTQTTRNQISATVGVSTTSQTAPAQTFTTGALVYQGGNYEFDGKVPASPETGIFSIDLSDLANTMPSATPSPQRFYLLVADNKTGSPTTLNSFALIDKTHNTSVNYAHAPISCDATSSSPYIDYDYAYAPVPDPTPPVVSITSPIDNTTVSGSVQVTMSATDNVGVTRVELYVDSALYATDTTAPYMITLDTTKLSNGNHQLTAIAYDAANNSAHHSIFIQVNNATFPSTLYINAGGGALSFQGISWTPDQYYSGTSATASNNIIFANPVYRTERNGRFSYILSVSNGSHNVTLKFAETTVNLPGRRVFNVGINGVTKLANFDLFRVAGFGVPYDRTFPVNVTNNTLRIDFVPIIGVAKVNAIQVTTP